MDKIFADNNSVEFIAPHSIYYKGTDIMEYCWNRLTYCDEADVNEILADSKNILIPESITIGRFMEIINSLRREKFGNSFMAYTPAAYGDSDDSDDSDDMSMDDMFGEGDCEECEDSEDKNDCKDCEDCGFRNYCEDEGVIYDKCCSDSSTYCDEFHSHITLADLISFFDTLNFKDNSNNSASNGFEPFDAGFNPFDPNDSLDRMLDNYELDMNSESEDDESDYGIFDENFQSNFESFDEYDKVMEELLNDYT